MTLIESIGMKKSPKSTSRGVFVVDSEGMVLAVEQGGPEATVDIVRGLVKKDRGTNDGAEARVATPTEVVATKLSTEDIEKANVAADVADTAEKLDDAGPAVIA
jgi:peroxiredoxin Q/BCP